MMWFAILSSIICFAIATLLFMEKFRMFVLYRPLAIYFLFKGMWFMMDFAVNTLWPGSWVSLTGGYIFEMVILGCLLFYMFKLKKVQDDRK